MMYNVESEVAVIVILTEDHTRLDDCPLECNHFSDAHQPIYQAMQRMVSFDLVSLSQEVEGCASYLSGLMADNFVPPSTLNYHVANILKAYQKAELKRLGASMISMDGTEEDIESVRGSLDSMLVEEKTDSNQDIVKRMWKGLEARTMSKDGVIGIRTGFDKLDRALGGFCGGRNIYLAARAKMGKTALVGNFLENICIKEKQPANVFTFEMSKEDWMQRLIFMIAKPQPIKNLDGVVENRFRFDKSSYNRLLEASDIVARSKINVYSCAGWPIERVGRIIRQNKRKFGVDFSVIDYLQKVAGRGSDYEIATHASLFLTDLSQSIKTNLITVAQLNRGNEDGAKPRRPRASDLRASGQLEQDADAVVLLHRPSHYDESCTDDDEIIIDLNRHGYSGVIKAQYNGEHYSWSERK